MKGTNIGEFEELILLTIAGLSSKAYSVAIVDELDKLIRRKAKLGVVHAVLNRLEKKGFIASTLGESTSERGGKRKRFYQLTTSGKSALVTAKEQREKLWAVIPRVVFSEIK